MTPEPQPTDIQSKEFTDEALQCQNCGGVFVHEVEAQRYHAERGWSAPLRCPSCREQRKARPTRRQRIELARTIGEQLGESAPAALYQIRRLLEVLPLEQVQGLLTQTEEVEASGGMWLEKAQRWRTRGGVFFVLAQQVLSPEQRAVAFPAKQWPKKPKRQLQAAAVAVGIALDASVTGPQHAPADASSAPDHPERVALPAGKAAQQGEATVKVTLIGRPGRVIEKQGYILTSMTGKPAPALPKGLPPPPAAPTLYTVYISAKQWKSVVEALQDEEDVLIAEGYPAYDPELEGLAVYVTGLTTKKLQAAKRQQQA